MPNAVVIGMQWGDEGKGKIVDLLSPSFDAVARFQGGNNAGHTVKFEDQHFALHYLPSGIIRPGMNCVIGNGVVLNPEAFFEELDALTARGIDVDGRLFVSDRAHVLLPTHVELDGARERARGKGKIGTTVRGIGPAYETKVSRLGLRVGELISDGPPSRLAPLLDRLSTELDRLGGPRVDRSAIEARCRKWGERLRPMVRDTGALLNDWMDSGRSILFEGAQGTLLDIDHGTYPYVTSSNSSAGGACTGTGVAPSRLGRVLGVLKAYTTRVGKGPFVCELEDDAGEFLRKRGNEFGTTTGRPRRCGWLDLVIGRYSARVNGAHALALTKLDVLDTLETIKVCVAYRIGGREVQGFPASLAEMENAQPVYEEVPGWQSSTVGVLSFDELPLAARDYVDFIEESLGVPVELVSTGPRREETITRQS